MRTYPAEEPLTSLAVNPENVDETGDWLGLEAEMLSLHRLALALVGTGRTLLSLAGYRRFCSPGAPSPSPGETHSWRLRWSKTRARGSFGRP